MIIVIMYYSSKKSVLKVKENSMDDHLMFIAQITEKTGITYETIIRVYKESNLTKHSELRQLFMDKFQLSYGFANSLVHIVKESDGAALAKGKDMTVILDEIYTGKKEQFRPIHELIMSRLSELADVELAPKKGYVSLRHNKQFAMIGPKTNTRMEIGLNIKNTEGTDRLLTQAKGSMCKFIVKLSSIEEVDDELINWIKEAYAQT